MCPVKIKPYLLFLTKFPLCVVSVLWQVSVDLLSLCSVWDFRHFFNWNYFGCMSESRHGPVVSSYAGEASISDAVAKLQRERVCVGPASHRNKNPRFVPIKCFVAREPNLSPLIVRQHKSWLHRTVFSYIIQLHIKSKSRPFGKLKLSQSCWIMKKIASITHSVNGLHVLCNGHSADDFSLGVWECWNSQLIDSGDRRKIIKLQFLIVNRLSHLKNQTRWKT